MSAVGVVALARETFDVPFAQETASRAFAVLDDVAPDWVGSRALLFDAAATQAAIDELAAHDLDALVVLQVTFTDATMTKALASSIEAPLVFWAFPERRTGERLRLNSLCGLNLAAFSLRRQQAEFGYLYRRPDNEAADELAALIRGDRSQPTTVSGIDVTPSSSAQDGADRVIAALSGAKTAVIGDHPDGFDPCEFDAATVRETTGVTVQRLELPELFSAADNAAASSVAAARERAEAALGSLDGLDQESLEQSLKLYCGLSKLALDNGWDGFATRCWPECFTDFRAAACAPQAMMSDDGVPGGCEADAYGTITSLILKELANAPAFIADLVDVDVADGTAAFWHCGVAPLHMADPETGASATIHSNRQKPLLHEFPLKPGRVTIARLSQARNIQSLVVGGGEMVRAPLPFSGTAGVVRFDRPADAVLHTVLQQGLEHHYGIVYGDYRAELVALADRWGLPVIALG